MPLPLRLRRHVIRRPRFYGAAALGVLLHFGLAWFGAVSTPVSLLLSWNISVLLFLALIFILMFTSDDDDMKERAKATDEGRFAVLALSFLAVIISLGATIVVLSRVRHGEGSDGVFHAALAAFTIASSWIFIHVIFTEHYAHEYYLARERRGEGGLNFADSNPPNYVDFLYFSFTIGVASQTADISIASRAMRATVLVHSILSYLFNAFILALTVNIASNLL
ncbi:putative membrane protein [Rhizobium sp. SG_E_25_P2]|uniref:DUF1345 domain-containing protein n=1 Tax=Rhizobium sp. SG_E_25_P2 TaxID=2879942 RepID=UPI002475C63D|nr:DUF1345 domain-containing protein [Rhizobium sp. SG_E_25_P2]MDH6269501.1 putative membrane protein [Rhizobium sp. SG_E_25_P2]